MKHIKSLSIVVPAFNEAQNLPLLLERIETVFRTEKITYEVIIIDDGSTDATRDVIFSLATRFPVRYFLKQGKQGKADSLIEGIDKVRYQAVAMIDADLQYPPEAFPEMLSKLSEGADIVVANRTAKNGPFLRTLASRVFRSVFGTFLHGLDCDVQSGLKVFKKNIFVHARLNPSPWTFDLELLLYARDAGYQIDSVEIDFVPRTFGQSKINLFQATWEIATHAVAAKLFRIGSPPALKAERSRRSFGFKYRGQSYHPYAPLIIKDSALVNLLGRQKEVFLAVSLLLLIYLFVDWHSTLVGLLALLTGLYFSDLLYNFFLILKSLRHDPELNPVSVAKQPGKLPRYTILSPLYKEWQVLPQFVEAIKKLDYPSRKLQVLLLLESDDRKTIRKAKAMKLPEYFEIVVVPHSKPKTKPKALNFALNKATGDYCVIFDAEDIPEPQQLKKVVAAFAQASENVVCLQAKLDFYNPNQNVLTRLFTAEYSLWFNLTLPGLQSVNAPIPLGGTSNHFKISALRQLYGWDAFNVTEDCDLGVRLAKYGFKTAIVDSVTFEEANSEFTNWFWQRTRWIKGYIQTFLVHSRHPRQFAKKTSWFEFGSFLLTVGGKILSLFINPLMWAITLFYFIARSTAGPIIESFFPPGIFYFGAASMIIGNFLYLYYYMIGAIKRQHYDLVKYTFLIPFYWLAMSAAAYVALYKLISAPHHWSKTAHGLHLNYPASTRLDTVYPVQPSYSTVR